MKTPFNTIEYIRKVFVSFKENDGFAHAGAIAYNSLLSIVPFVILVFLVFSGFVDKETLLTAMQGTLDLLLPGQSQTILSELEHFIDNSGTVGIIMFGTLIFFGTLSFSSIDAAFNSIFLYRGKNERHPVVSMLIPYGYLLGAGTVLILFSVIYGRMEALSEQGIHLWGIHLLDGNTVGLLGQALMFVLQTIAISSFYLFLPTGRTSLHFSIYGGIFASVSWKIARSILAWYLGSMSKAGLVYGTLSSAITCMLCVEVAAIILLLGANAISVAEQQPNS